jgi:hypothetical protein
MCGVACCRKEWGGSFQQYFYNRYKIVVYTGLRSDSIKNYASRNEARRIAAMRIIFKRISYILFTCDMYMCRLRHINDPVLSSLKMEGIRFFFLFQNVKILTFCFTIIKNETLGLGIYGFVSG